MDFTTMDIATLTHNVTGEGVRYLELFLREYTAIFPGPVNPACPLCLNQYLTKYKDHYRALAKKCAYRLHPEFENIPLQFGSPVLVNNDNINNAYARVLLSHPNGARYFSQLPETQANPANKDFIKHGPE
ncbi:hypothetical protein [Flavobacterium psychrotrophum]|uniref:hypothetical protein n=1 Tax=Flavobacterium psychrotrophum TaxID=2294119 RepID=UPI000E310F92|nr:hypothetical protein [Flavobacterium psychrotrophum]